MLPKFYFQFKPPPKYKIFKIWPLHEIDLDKLENDSLLSPVPTADSSVSTLSELLDRQSPLKIKMVVEHLPQVKSSAISEANQNNKHQRSQLEHWWCHSQLSADDHTKQYVYKSFFHLPNLNI